MVIVLCTADTGLVWWCLMAWRLDMEPVKMPIHACVANVVRAVCMATSSARVMVRVSYALAAST